MTDVEAVQRLADMTDAGSDPAIGESRLLTILSERQRPVAVFAPNMVCPVGLMVLPSAGDLRTLGVCYLVVSPGVATVEPAWPQPGASARDTVYSGLVGFRLLGVYNGNPYDLRAAARQVFTDKAAVCAKRMDVANGPDRVMLSQQRLAFLAMASTYGPEWPL
jgi:hypothetical protein